MTDQTAPASDHARRVRRELKFYKEVENVHDLPASHDYVGGRFVAPKLRETFGYADFPGMILQYLRASPGPDDHVEVLSLGSGNCDFEIDLVSANALRCRVTCLELNPEMLQRAGELARERGVEAQFTFIETDINELALDRQYDLILASHSLHHFVALEKIFDEVARAMQPTSLFLINDMIGRNFHMMYPATLDMVNRLWDLFPAELKVDRRTGRFVPHRLQIDPSGYGFEGIRAQDILPLLDERFAVQDFAPFFTLANRFVDRDFGHSFDLEDPLHTAILDHVAQLDDYCCRERLLRPTQMFAALRPQGMAAAPRLLHGLAPRDVYTLSDDALYGRFEPEVAKRTEALAGTRLLRRGWRRLRRW
jgi:SAM-dependent methyltransferase